jgi:hypothetical protein
MFVDNVKIFGSVRNIYLKISGVVMAVSLLSIQLPLFQNKYATLSLLVTFNLFSACADVVIDAIMVQWARLDPVHGSSDMQSLHVISIWIGGISGSLTASVVNDMFHPYQVFSFYSVTVLLITVLACWAQDMPVENNLGAWEKIKISLMHMKKGIVLGTLIFMLISRAIIPSYSDIMYYFMINVLEFSKKTIALLALASFSTAIIGSFFYNIFLKKWEFRVTMIIAHVIIAWAVMTTYLLVSRISKEVFGINDVLFALFTDSALEILFVAFVFMPMLVVQTKIIPKNVEATVYSVFASLRNIAHDFISPVVGGVIAQCFNVSKNNFKNIGSIVIIQFCWSLIPIMFIWLLPSNKTIEDFHTLIRRDNEDNGGIGHPKKSFASSTDKALNYVEFDHEKDGMSKMK